MTNEVCQKLDQDLAQLHIFVQDYLIQVNGQTQLGEMSFSEQLTRMLAPYSAFQLEIMHEQGNEHIVSQWLVKLLEQPALEIPEEDEFNAEVMVLKQLLHTPGQLIKNHEQNEITLNAYNMTLLINTLTRITLIRYICTHFQAIERFKTEQAAKCSQEFPLVKKIDLPWLQLQFDEIKEIISHPHRKVNNAQAQVPAKAFPAVGGKEIELTWQPGVQAAIQAPEPNVPVVQPRIENMRAHPIVEPQIIINPPVNLERAMFLPPDWAGNELFMSLRVNAQRRRRERLERAAEQERSRQARIAQRESEHQERVAQQRQRQERTQRGRARQNPAWISVQGGGRFSNINQPRSIRWLPLLIISTALFALVYNASKIVPFFTQTVAALTNHIALVGMSSFVPICASIFAFGLAMTIAFVALRRSRHRGLRALSANATQAPIPAPQLRDLRNYLAQEPAQQASTASLQEIIQEVPTTTQEVALPAPPRPRAHQRRRLH